MESSENFTLEGYKFVHLTYKILPLTWKIWKIIFLQ